MYRRPHGVAAELVTTTATSKQKLRGTSRDHIIDVSRAMIEDEGVEQLAIRRIAETINRTQPAVYQHFSSKDAILAAVVIEGFTALAEHLKRAPRGGATSLITIANAYVRFGLERPRLYEVMFVGPPVIAFAVADTPTQTAFKSLQLRSENRALSQLRSTPSRKWCGRLSTVWSCSRSRSACGRVEFCSARVLKRSQRRSSR